MNIKDKLQKFVKKDLDILIVDDSKEDRVLLVEHLNTIAKEDQNNFDITQVNSVRKALEILQTQTYDLMFLDFMMDDGDGFEVLLKLTKNQKEAIPIVFLTGYGNSMIKEDSFSIGARAYLSKDELNSASLHQVIKKAVN